MLNNKTNILIKTEKEISYMREAGHIIADIMNKMERQSSRNHNIRIR